MSEGLYDEDGIDGPFERRMKKVVREVEEARRRRDDLTTAILDAVVGIRRHPPLRRRKGSRS